MSFSHFSQHKIYLFGKKASHACVVLNITQKNSSVRAVGVCYISLAKQVALALLCWSVEFHNRFTGSIQHIDHIIWHHNNTTQQLPMLQHIFTEE